MDTMVKPISPEPLSEALQGPLAQLDVPDDVFEHDDGVVDHEPDGKNQGHSWRDCPG